MKVNISVEGQEDLKIDSLNFKNTSTFVDLQQKIAEQLGVSAKEIQLLSCKSSGFVNPKSIQSNWANLSLMDAFGLSDTAVISISVRGANKIIPKYENLEEKQRTFKEQMKKIEAQSGLKWALENALSDHAHIIITVGSHLPVKHLDYNDSVKRQQFPIERLGDISSEDPVHLVHLDPGFSNPNGLQWHDQDGWKCKSEGLVSTYTKDNFTITTIAHSIDNDREGMAYFSKKGTATTILDVSLDHFIDRAKEVGTGFITGNFYSKETPVEVINIPPKQSYSLEHPS